MSHRLYPVPREVLPHEAGLTRRSGLIGETLPNPAATALLFHKPLRGLIQVVATVAASALIAFTPPVEAGPPVNVLFQRPLTRIVQELVTPPPSVFRTPEPIIEQGLANLLFNKSLAGIFQPETVVPLPSIVQVPFASPTDVQKLLFQQPLVGREQLLEVVAPSDLITIPTEPAAPPIDVLFQRPLWGIERPDEEIRQRVSLLGRVHLTAPAAINVLFQYPLVGRDQPIHVERAPIQIKFPQPPPPEGINTLFQRPLAGRADEPLIVLPSALIVVPVADIAPPAPDILFLYALTGKDQREVGLEARSILSRIGLTSTPIPVNVLFQRSLIGRVQDILDPGRPRILRVQVPDPPAIIPSIFFLRPLLRGPQPPELEYASTLLFGLDPERSILFLRPLRGQDQPGLLVGLPKITRVVPDIAPPAINLLFQRPFVGRAQEIVREGPPRFILVPVADVAPTPINVLFQRPLAGPLEPSEIFRRPDLVRVVAGTIPLNILFQRPLIALGQLEVEVEPSDILRVRAADPPPDPGIVLFQWALTGVLQPEEAVGPGRIIRRSYTETPQLVSGVLMIVYSDGTVALVDANGTIIPQSAFVMIVND